MPLIAQPVLLVEDDAHDVLMFRHLMKKLHRQVQVVADGDKAMAYLSGKPPFHNRSQHPMPCIVFLDLNLPGRSGFEVLAWIRQNPKFNKVRVVVLTGSNKTIDIYRAYELGADSFMAKPVKMPGLDQLAGALGLPWLRGPSATSPTVAEPSPSNVLLPPVTENPPKVKSVLNHPALSMFSTYSPG